MYTGRGKRKLLERGNDGFRIDSSREGGKLPRMHEIAIEREPHPGQKKSSSAPPLSIEKGSEPAQSLLFRGISQGGVT